MRLLTRTAHDLRRLGVPDFALSLGLAGVVVALEVLGRHTATDLHDLLALFALALLAVLVGLRHRRAPLGWVTALLGLGRRAGTALRRITFEPGLDLRGVPRVRRGTPPLVLGLASALVLWSGLALLFADACPHRVRAAAVRIFYLGYLVPLALVWLATALVGLLAFFIPVAMMHDAFVGAHVGPGRRPRRREFWAIAGYLATLTAFAAVLPLAVSLALCGTILILSVAICWLPARADVRFVWRPHGTVRVRSMSWNWWWTCEFTLITLAVVALVLTTCGDRLTASPGGLETMPVTAMMGLTLAWLAPGALVALFLQMALGRLRDPARRAPPVAHVAGAAARAAVRAAFRRHGWRVRFAPARPGPIDVAVEMVERRLPLDETTEPRWPLAVTTADLDDPALWERLARRAEVQHRRKLLATLEGLFKHAAGKRSKPGSGYWVAPHFWFIGGLMREGDQEVDGMADEQILSRVVGPPYHRVLPRAVRHHAYRLLRALQIDLIFVEDGVTWKRLRRVLRALFEVYDVHGGRRAAEEIDFRGLPGTRVLIHDFQFDDPFKSDVYPEPKYDYLGRARLLHVFRDRGEHEELLEPPFDFSRTPAPVSAV